MSAAERQARLRAALRECPIYGILDESLFADRLPLAVAEQWLAAGIKLIQLRAKNLLSRVWLELAQELRRECDESSALFILNDRVDIALMASADGVHLGEQDPPIEAVRRIAPGLIIGGTARYAATAMEIEAAGADYIGCGSVFTSNTKPGLPVIGTQGLSEVCAVTQIPAFAIGGITAQNIRSCIASGAAGVCMVQGLASADNLDAAIAAARRLGDGN